MKMSEAAKKLGLNGQLASEWMDVFHPLGGGRFAAYDEMMDRISPELRDALGNRAKLRRRPDYDCIAVDLSNECE